MPSQLGEAIALIILVLAAVYGNNKGLAYMLYQVVSAGIRFALTVILFVAVLPLVSVNFAGKEGIIFIIVLAIANGVLRMLASLLKLIDKIPVVSFLNRSGGVLLGIVYGMVVIWICLVIIGLFKNVEYAKPLIEMIKGSNILMQVQGFNPLAIVMTNFDFSVLTKGK